MSTTMQTPPRKPRVPMRPAAAPLTHLEQDASTGQWINPRGDLLKLPPGTPIIRYAHLDACDDCYERAGVYANNNPTAYVTHPNCQCSWEVAPPGTQIGATMSLFAKVMKKEDDGEHPASHYLVVEDVHHPTTWHLRVMDPDGKPDHRLMGAAWAALHGGWRGQKYDGPDKAKAISKLTALYKREGMDLPDVTNSAGFALESTARREGALVIRRGKVFEGGDYPDKHFAITPDELQAAVAEFTPVPVDLEHVSTPLDGKLGELRAVEVGPDGWSLYGEVALPAWLDAALEGTGRKVSATWDRATKRLRGLALVNHPRISDAALMAAFADRHDTRHGRDTLQTLHDIAARAGAVCDPETAGPRGNSRFVSTHEATALQAVHDATVEHGAQCSDLGNGGAADLFSALFASRRHSAADMADIQQIHDLAAKQGAACPPETDADGDDDAGMGTRARRQKGRLMNFAFWKKTTAAERAELARLGAAVPDESVFGAAEELAAAKLAEERARFEEQLRAERAKRLETEAIAFAEDLIRASKAFPAEREALIAAYTQAAMDDVTHGAASFTGAGTTSRVDALKALYAARPAHGLTRETIDPRGGVRVLAPQVGMSATPTAQTVTPEGAEPTKERMTYLLKLAGADRLPGAADPSKG